MASMISSFLVICLLLSSFVGTVEARVSDLSGDYVEDTIEVAQTLKEAIEAPTEENNSEASEEKTLALINEYMSRYRPNQRVNTLNSFTTMQTALNSLAGHYKYSPNRPVPEKLKNRLNEELSKAESTVVRES